MAGNSKTGVPRLPMEEPLRILKLSYQILFLTLLPKDFLSEVEGRREVALLSPSPASHSHSPLSQPEGTGKRFRWAWAEGEVHKGPNLLCPFHCSSQRGPRDTLAVPGLVSIVPLGSQTSPSSSVTSPRPASHFQSLP